MLATIGGRYAWLDVPCLIASTLLFLASGARIGADPATRAIDLVIIATLAFIALQLLPLPFMTLARISPGTLALQDRYALTTLGSWRSLSIDPAATRETFVLALTAAFVFWAARESFARGGNRAAMRTLAVVGFVCAIVSLGQRATAPRTVLWAWRIADPRAMPFGLFVDRNQLATWLVLAVSVVGGYFAMHLSAHMSTRMRRGAHALAVALTDAGSLAIAGCLLAMLITLAATTSRSGFVAVVVSAITGASLSRGSGRYGLRFGMIVAVAFIAVAAWLNPDLLVERIVSTIAPADPNGVSRVTIWRETLRIIHDFPWLGSGAGTFQDAMFVYQQRSREVLFNHAHNEYLQLLTEGGVTLLALVAAGVMLLARSARMQLDADAGAHRFLRVGACSGIVGIGVQSIWETGLRAPANLLLIALLAAIAVRPMDRITEEKIDA